MNEPIKVFISYAHKDDELRKELIPHLAGAQNEKLIELWHDREIRAGADWAKEIDEKLELADIILFLVSPDFINSRYCSGIEMARAIERHKAKTARAIPVIIRYSDWTTTRLSELQAIPRDNKPVASWGDDPKNPMARDEPWLLVAKEISQVARDIRNKRIVEFQAAQKAKAKEEFRAKAQDSYRDYCDDGGLDSTAKRLLERERKRLGLEEPEAREILQEIEAERQQHQDNLAEYREELVAKLADRAELTVKQRNLLQRFQADLDISNGEAEQIEREVLSEQSSNRQRVRSAAETPLLRHFSFQVVTVDGNGREKERANETARFFAEDLGSDVSLEMVYIPGGTFQMGSPAGQGDADERPQHAVTVPAFLMGKYPVTQEQWRAVAALPQAEIALEVEPSSFQGDRLPVEQVSWSQAVEFCQRLSRWTGQGYRLPSEAEWEYACRAGSKTHFYFGETITTDLANYDGNYTYGNVPKGEYRQKTTNVGSFPPNSFGLYDLHGNVWEWCADRWHENYIGAPTDGSPWLNGDSDRRVIRGGSWYYKPTGCRAANRYHITDIRYDYVGFRVVCVVFPGLL